ncbi:MAG: hypothetical protein GXP22_01540 [Gammaproteobacteria bacterium]|nr:hypothetical protein [Gammaproteobacteria bacterium]
MKNQHLDLTCKTASIKRNIPAFNSIALALGLLLTPTTGSSQILEFDYTATFTMVTASGEFFTNISELGNSTNGNRTPVTGSMQYDTTLDAGTLLMVPFWFNESILSWVGMEMEGIGSNRALFNGMFNWNGIYGVPVSLVWDATGLNNAINSGLSNGSIINGSLGGAIPATSNTVKSYGPSGGITYPVGPSPLATTTFDTTPVNPPVSLNYTHSGQLPIINDLIIDATNGDIGIGGSPLLAGPFLAYNINIDFNTLELTSMSAVPAPAALWLFGSGLIGLLAVSRRHSEDQSDTT